MIRGIQYHVWGQGKFWQASQEKKGTLEGPGEDGEWYTKKAAQKYVERIAQPKKNPQNKGDETAITPEQLGLAQEALDAVGQHGHLREYADPQRYIHMVCLYPSAQDFEAKGEPAPEDSLLGAYENLDSPEVLACLVPGMVVDIFVCEPCEDDEEPEVIDNVTVELTGKPMKGTVKGAPKATSPAAPKAPPKAPTKAPPKASSPARAQLSTKAPTKAPAHKKTGKNQGRKA